MIIVKGPIELRKVADEHEVDQCGDTRQHADREKAAREQEDLTERLEMILNWNEW